WGGRRRAGSPAGGSTLTTSAPRSPRSFPARNPGSPVRSSTRVPSSMPRVADRAASALAAVATDELQERVDVDGLPHVGDDTRGPELLGRPVRRDDDDRRPGLEAPLLLHELPAVHPRHHEVEKDDARI